MHPALRCAYRHLYERRRPRGGVQAKLASKNAKPSPCCLKFIQLWPTKWHALLTLQFGARDLRGVHWWCQRLRFPLRAGRAAAVRLLRSIRLSLLSAVMCWPCRQHPLGGCWCHYGVFRGGAWVVEKCRGWPSFGATYRSLVMLRRVPVAVPRYYVRPKSILSTTN